MRTPARSLLALRAGLVPSADAEAPFRLPVAAFVRSIS